MIISNKALKELYINMFKDNNININFKYNLNEKDYVCNIIENLFKNEENINKLNNIEDELFKDKIFKTGKKNFTFFIFFKYS